MKISSFKIKNFRTINSEQTVNLSRGLTIVGPNNSGKSNTLLAIYYFFIAQNNTSGYNAATDLPFNQENVQTSLTCNFSFDMDQSFDREIMRSIGKMKNLLVDHKNIDTSSGFSLNLVFRPTPVYQVFPGVKQSLDKRSEYIALQKSVIERILGHFKCYKIPSDKSVERIYLDFIMPLVKKEIAAAMAPYDDEIRSSIRSLSASINSTLEDSGVDEIKVTLDYPQNALENLISALDLQVEDTSKSSIYSKGMGLQSTVLFSALEWVTKQQPDNHIIWLIEEPETYMHPALSHKACRILDRLGKSSTLVKTTHSLSFVPSDAESVVGVTYNRNEKSTNIESYKTILAATSDIRSGLGVRFSDYFSLSDVNIFVEGETDIEYLKAAMSTYSKTYNRELFMQKHDVRFLSFGGCTDLSGFLRANFEFISKEVIAVSLFDGDDAGDKATQALRNFFNNKGGFLPDRDYTSVPNGEIECLFPDEWIWNVKEEHPNWIEDIDFDARKTIKMVKIKDEHKKQFMRLMLEYMRNPHHDFHPTKFDDVLETLDSFIEKSYRRLFNINTKAPQKQMEAV